MTRRPLEGQIIAEWTPDVGPFAPWLAQWARRFASGELVAVAARRDGTHAIAYVPAGSRRIGPRSFDAAHEARQTATPEEEGT